MTDIPINASETILLTVLLLFWATSLFGGFIFGKENSEQKRRMPTWTRLLSSVILTISAWAWFVISQDSQVINPFTTWIAIGMTLGLVGDLLMAQILPIQQHILGGMAAFGIGHIAYIIGMVSIGQNLSLNNADIYQNSLIFWWGFALVSWYMLVFRSSKRSLVHYVALPYALLLASTAGFATALAIQDSNFILIALGAILFLVSDLILAMQLFNDAKFRLIGDIVWLLYGPGQMFIVFGLILATITQ